MTKETRKTFLFNYEILTCREGHDRYSRIEKYSGPNLLYVQGGECQKTRPSVGLMNLAEVHLQNIPIDSFLFKAVT